MCWVTSMFDSRVFVRNGSQAVAPLIVDHRLLAVLTYAPKVEFLDEIFDANQGAGAGQFSSVQIFTTKDRCRVYQVESPRGLSKIWMPYDPQLTAGIGDETTQKIITANIPRGTVVGVGLVGNETRWYIASTYKGKTPSKQLPLAWRLELPGGHDNAAFVRNGTGISTPFIVDRDLLEVMTRAPKNLVDEVFDANEGAGEERFSCAQLFATKDTCLVYQAESPAGLSKTWLPYDPRFMPGTRGGTVQRLIRASIPKGTVVGVGLVGSDTRWYIPNTYKSGDSFKRVPPGWRLETLAATSTPPGVPPQPVSA